MSKNQEEKLRNFKEPRQNRQKNRKTEEKQSKISKNGQKRKLAKNF